jgi:hypothetical protein
MRSMCFRIEEALEEEPFLDQLEVFFGKQMILPVQEATLRPLNSGIMETVSTTRLWENDHSYFFILIESFYHSKSIATNKY